MQLKQKQFLSLFLLRIIFTIIFISKYAEMNMTEFIKISFNVDIFYEWARFRLFSLTIVTYSCPI